MSVNCVEDLLEQYSDLFSWKDHAAFNEIESINEELVTYVEWLNSLLGSLSENRYILYRSSETTPLVGNYIFRIEYALEVTLCTHAISMPYVKMHWHESYDNLGAIDLERDLFQATCPFNYLSSTYRYPYEDTLRVYWLGDNSRFLQ